MTPVAQIYHCPTDALSVWVFHCKDPEWLLRALLPHLYYEVQVAKPGLGARSLAREVPCGPRRHALAIDAVVAPRRTRGY